MKQTLIMAVLAMFAVTAKAQTKAITQHGKTVILYDNGTWEYEKPGEVNQAIAPQKVAEAPMPTFKVDAGKDITSEKIEVFNSISKKMARFFGEEKGKIRCSATCTNNKGKISLNFEFMVPVGDANRYFGYSLLERGLTMQLGDGKNMNLIFSKNNEEKFIEKWNISYYKASVEISNEDLVNLLKHPVLRMTIDWKKKPEEYNVDNTKALQGILIDVI